MLNPSNKYKTWAVQCSKLHAIHKHIGSISGATRVFMIDLLLGLTVARINSSNRGMNLDSIRRPGQTNCLQVTIFPRSRIMNIIFK
jgi:hypothetical protein